VDDDPVIWLESTMTAALRVRSKLKGQNSSTFQGPKLHISSTKIIDKKPYPRRGHSKFRLQCDTEVYCTVLTNTVMIKAKFQNLQHLNSRTFQVLSSTLSVFKHFQGPWSFYSKFKHFHSQNNSTNNSAYRQMIDVVALPVDLHIKNCTVLCNK